MGLLLALVLLSLAPVGADAPLPGDFNQDQRLDQEDLKLLRAALGSADSLYDLNGDSRVDLDDFFRWADEVEIAPATVLAPDSSSVVSISSPGEGTAVPDTALPLQPLLPADTTALVSAVPDSASGEILPADTTALVPAVPDSSSEVLPADTTTLVPAVPDSSSEVLPADTTALVPAVPDSPSGEIPPADTTALVTAVPDSSSAEILPADTTALSAAAALPPDPTSSVPPAAADSTVFIPAASPLDSAAFVPLPFQPVSPAYCAVATTRQTTTVWFTGYTIVLHNSKPFGIASLRLKGQPVDFVHPSLPLGDWEWFWFSDPSQPEGRARIKLIEQTWQSPQVERTAEGVVLRFRQQDVLRSGVEVEVAYHLDARRPEFTVEYTIRNHSGRFLVSPYMMVGFPGFANQQWVEEVSTAEKVRRPLRPFADFLAEAQARKLTDYLLLRQDWDPQTQAPEALKGTVVLRGEDKEYTLTTILAAASGLRGAYIAHTNKPRYLTSHLYAFLQSLGQGESRSVAVHYVLSSGK